MDIRIVTLSLAAWAWTLCSQAQQVWTVNDCMAYAVKHNHNVRKQQLELDSYRSSQTQAIGAFLPSIDGGVGAQYNFGRAIDPETNTYTNVSTFYNSYSMSASVQLFDGLQRLNKLNAARADVLMGKSSLQSQQDQAALNAFQAFVNVLYYQGTVQMAEAKLKESQLMLQQTRIMEEVGTKSAADVAQMEAQLATDDYDLTCQQSLFSTALLTLKQEMSYPMDQELTVDSLLISGLQLSPTLDNVQEVSEFALKNNPGIQQASYARQSARHHWLSAKGSLFPTLSMGGGINTTYNKTLHNPHAASFRNQFRNNEGEYLAFHLSIPLFNRLSTVSNIRKARNSYRIAQEQYDAQCDELRKLVEQALLDRESYLKQSIQMDKKVKSDELAYQLVKRQYEEGLSNPIEVQTNAATLLQSRATLLQSRLMFLLKDKLVEYYKGKDLY